MNEHWLDKKGKSGMSEYFWKYKYPCLLEATGHTSEEVEKLISKNSPIKKYRDIL